jgi:hypothetical protein
MKLIYKLSKGLLNHKKDMVRFMLVGIMFIVFSACDDNDDAADTGPTPTPVDKGTLLLHLHNYIDESDIGELPGLSNPDNNGRQIIINKANIYISEIQAVDQDGVVYNFTGKKILKIFENVLYEVGEIPVGSYSIIRFKVGLDAATNALDPTSSPDSSILNIPEMWFGSSAQPDGYVFMNLQGSIDTSSNLAGSFAPFIYKIGTNANYKQVTINGINVTIVKGQASTAHMVADYNKLFSGIAINQNGNLSITTAAENSSPLATAIVNNMTQIFKPE